MSDTVITVDSLSKSYKIGLRERQGRTFRETATDALLSPFRRLRSIAAGGNGASTAEDTFWALKDVSFEVKRGEVVGIIGRNGAGKSTLLKILSRITEPTSGEVRLRGRVASLLEVGTGFHPELTGRENIYLNGAILGMKRAEITRKFDEIVAFAEVEKFLDTAVKRYSSGMYVRLAFAVAAHLEPEILIVDEVLAVGDAEFQKKCLGKMQDVAKGEGRTVLFVSHNMAAVNRLCATGVWLEHGMVQEHSAVEECVQAYMHHGANSVGQRTWAPELRPGTGGFHLHSVRVCSPDGMTMGRVDVRKPFIIELDYDLSQDFNEFRTAIRLQTSDGTVAFTSADSADVTWVGRARTAGTYRSRCYIPGSLLNQGLYSVTVSADVPFREGLAYEDGVISVEVEQTGGVSGRYPEKWPGVVCPDLKWNVVACG